LQLETGTAWQASPSAGPRSKAEHVDAVAYKLRRGLKLSQTSAIAFQAVPRISDGGDGHWHIFFELDEAFAFIYHGISVEIWRCSRRPKDP
jgi:hypothetical protein